jgi:hypothetical protein
MTLKLSIKTAAFLLCIGASNFLAGCKTIDTNTAAKFATSVTAVKTQADTALTAAANLTRDAGITYVASRPSLNEEDFAETPSSDVIVQWDNTLSVIETYALNLATLTSPDATKAFDTSATNLFNQFTQTATKLNANALQTSSPEVAADLATAFTEVAHLILEAKAQATARKVALATDPQISKILNLLATEIGDDHNNACLRTTIYRVWNTEKDALSGPFLKASDLTGKKAIVQQYATILAERAAEDELLASLRHSLLTLADAHHALAEGNEPSVLASSTVIVNELQRSHDLYAQFSSDLKSKN